MVQICGYVPLRDSGASYVRYERRVLEDLPDECVDGCNAMAKLWGGWTPEQLRKRCPSEDMRRAAHLLAGPPSLSPFAWVYSAIDGQFIAVYDTLEDLEAGMTGERLDSWGSSVEDFVWSDKPLTRIELSEWLHGLVLREMGDRPFAELAAPPPP